MEQTVMYVTVAITALILLSASVFDWKYREIPDWHWVVMFLTAIAVSIMVIVKGSTGIAGVLMPVCIGLIAFDCLYDRDSGMMFDTVIYLAIAVTALSAYLTLDDNIGRTFISIPIMYAAMTVLYYTGIIKGGADAKSIIAIAAVFPTYPEILGMPLIPVPDGPMSQVFIPAFAVLTMALVLSLLYGVYNIVRNLISGDVLMPQMFMGTRMPLEKAKVSKVWPMADMVDGEIVTTSTANEDEDIWERLETHGADEVWVTAIIPFLIPITVAFFLTVTIGFPIFIL